MDKTPKEVKSFEHNIEQTCSPNQFMEKFGCSSQRNRTSFQRRTKESRQVCQSCVLGVHRNNLSEDSFLRTYNFMFFFSLLVTTFLTVEDEI